MSYVVRQLLISDSQAVQELIASRNGTKYYSTEIMISSQKLNAIFADPVNLYVSAEHTTGIDYDPIKDLIYVGERSTALIGLFDNNNLSYLAFNLIIWNPRKHFSVIHFKNFCIKMFVFFFYKIFRIKIIYKYPRLFFYYSIAFVK